MYRGFNLKVPTDCFQDYDEDGLLVHLKQKAAIRSAIELFKNSDGSLNASKITADWFPRINADVFISHSKNDSELTVRLAGFLQYEFGLTSFVDSSAWGYADDLLRILVRRILLARTQKCVQLPAQKPIYRPRSYDADHGSNEDDQQL
jgi:hypothetical protein